MQTPFKNRSVALSPKNKHAIDSATKNTRNTHFIVMFTLAQVSHVSAIIIDTATLQNNNKRKNTLDRDHRVNSSAANHCFSPSVATQPHLRVHFCGDQRWPVCSHGQCQKGCKSNLTSILDRFYRFFDLPLVGRGGPLSFCVGGPLAERGWLGRYPHLGVFQELAVEG